MSKNFKTIAVLQKTDVLYINNAPIRVFRSEDSRDTFLLEAYSSLESAINALDEEVLFCINNIIFKKCEIIRSEVLYRTGTEDPIKFQIEYASDTHRIYKQEYMISLINLVL